LLVLTEPWRFETQGKQDCLCCLRVWRPDGTELTDLKIGHYRALRHEPVRRRDGANLATFL
jgi:hypothetical protein